MSISQPNETLLAQGVSAVVPNFTRTFTPHPAATKVALVAVFSVDGTLRIDVENPASPGTWEPLASQSLTAGSVGTLVLDYNPGTIRPGFVATAGGSTTATGYIRATYSGHGGGLA